MGCCSDPSPDQYETAGSFWCAKRGWNVTFQTLGVLSVLIMPMAYFAVAAGANGDECSASCFGETGKCCVSGRGSICPGQCYCTEDDRSGYTCEDPDELTAGGILIILAIFLAIGACFGWCFRRGYLEDKEIFDHYHSRVEDINSGTPAFDAMRVADALGVSPDLLEGSGEQNGEKASKLEAPEEPTEATEREEAPQQPEKEQISKDDGDELEKQMASRYGIKIADAKSSLAKAKNLFGVLSSAGIDMKETIMEAAYQIHQSEKGQQGTNVATANMSTSSNGAAQTQSNATPSRQSTRDAPDGNAQIQQHQDGTVIYA